MSVEMLRYDSNTPPDVDEWLAADERERIAAVVEYHRGRKGPHPEAESPLAHGAFHAIVENQIAGNDPPEVRAALERLVADGCSRHEAIHAVGSVIAEETHAIMTAKRPFDRNRVARALAGLSPETWRGSTP